MKGYEGCSHFREKVGQGPGFLWWNTMEEMLEHLKLAAVWGLHRAGSHCGCHTGSVQWEWQCAVGVAVCSGSGSMLEGQCIARLQLEHNVECACRVCPYVPRCWRLVQAGWCCAVLSVCKAVVTDVSWWLACAGCVKLEVLFVAGTAGAVHDHLRRKQLTKWLLW